MFLTPAQGRHWWHAWGPPSRAFDALDHGRHAECPVHHADDSAQSVGLWAQLAAAIANRRDWVGARDLSVCVRASENCAADLMSCITKRQVIV